MKIVRRPSQSIFSLKNFQEKQDEKATTDDTPDASAPKTPFDAQQFDIVWNDYLKKIKTENQPAYNVMETAKWKLNTNHEVLLTFDSDVMKLEFEEIRSDFMDFIRTRLNNFHIQTKTEISTSQKTVSHIKSKQEIFQDLVDINPAVETFRQIFNLNIGD